MNAKVKLTYIAGELSLIPEAGSSFLNRKTGKVFRVTNEDMRRAELENKEDKADDDEAAGHTEDENEDDQGDEVETGEESEWFELVELPSKFAGHEYNIMQEFCRLVNNDQISNRLNDAIRGSDTFRCFENEIRRCGIENDWYKHRNVALMEVARQWCETCGIEYIDDRSAEPESEDDQLTEKERFYRSLSQSTAALLDGERDFLANMANVSALLFEELPDVNWAGFYLLKGKDLVLGPFQGKPACTRIGPGKGVCGAAAEKRKSVVVENVKKFPGHIACDKATKSEVVVPMIKADRLLGVLDIDSAMLARFDDEDRGGLEEIVRLLLEASDEGN